MTTMANSPATICWINQQPVSTLYDDVYFSTDDGLAESRYVFLSGNDLPSRWASESLSTNDFTIIETGFGTGLNFCCAAQLWQQLKCKQHLNFISIEKHPLAADALKQALAHWPELNTTTTALYKAYCNINAKPLTQTVTLDVLPNISLTLLIGDILDQIKLINQPADAWFLDGFSPAKNPDMWQSAMFKEMAKRSNKGTTLATFTSAGFVRRGLSDVGFQMTKRPGFGKKREMLTGQWISIHEAP